MISCLSLITKWYRFSLLKHLNILIRNKEKSNHVTPIADVISSLKSEQGKTTSAVPTKALSDPPRKRGRPRVSSEYHCQVFFLMTQLVHRWLNFPLHTPHTQTLYNKLDVPSYTFFVRGKRPRKVFLLRIMDKATK